RGDSILLATGTLAEVDGRSPHEDLKASALSRLAAPARASLWVVGALLALSLSMQWSAVTGVHNDFTQNVWLPSRLVLDGANPYHPTRTQVDAALGAYSKDFVGFNSGKEYQFI